MLAPNTILQNRYRIVRKLGQGGMGAIYEAVDSRVSCVVALKETLVGSNPTLREAFHREAALLANLRHACLPKVTDYFGEGDGEFLVMEFIAGDDLLELMKQREGPLPQTQVLQWAIELLKLLEYLHTHDPAIIHRDIKPANLKVTKEGELFLLDFGLAKGSTGQMMTVSTDQSVPGYTPIYAPIEQILGQGTDQRTDLYAVGATLYHLLTGQPPVSASARFSAIDNNQPDPLKPANQLNLRVASEVATCIQNAMGLSRRDRIENAHRMRIDLELALRLITDRAIADEAERNLLEHTPARDSSKPPVVDEGVQFTVYAPEQIKPDKDYSLLAFAHLTSRRDDASPDEPDPIEEMKTQAARLLGEQREEYRDTKDSSSQPVPRGGEITFVPVVRGLTFNPPSRSFTWQKSVHREEFDVRASADVDGRTLQGSMTVFLGGVVIADVGLTIAVDSRATPAKEKISLGHARTGRRLRQVFASYSRQDEQVVNELAQVAPLFGSRFLLDRTHLDPGEDRIEGMQRLIRDADLFQLFWSTNSMRSAEVADEIRYATSLGRQGFILPTHWEDPVPRSPAEGLPPPEIDRLQFYRINPGAISDSMLVKGPNTRVVILGPPGSEIYVDDERQGSIGSSGRVVLTSIRTGTHVLRVTHHGDNDDERVISVRADTAEQIFETFRKVPITPTEASPYGSAEVPFEQVVQHAPLKDEAATGKLSLPPQTSLPTPAGDHARNTINCDTCGMRNSADLHFCVNCGSVLSESDTHRIAPTLGSPPPASREEYPSEKATWAPAPTSVQAPRSAPQMSPPQKARRGMLIPIFAGVAMVFFAIIIAPVWFVLNRSAGDSSSVTTNTRPEPVGINPSSNTSANSNRGPRADIQFLSLDGRMMNLKEFSGGIVLLNFWAPSNESSRVEVPLLNDVQQKYGPRGVRVIGLSYETAEQVRKFQKEIPAHYIVGLVGNGAKGQKLPIGLSVPSLPTTYILDENLRIRKQMVGIQTREAFEAAIDELINERR